MDAVVRVVDAQTLWLPDWKGNNRLDSLRNLVRDGRLSLMFMVLGSNTVVRINRKAVVTADPQIVEHFNREGKTPCTVTVIGVREVYFQCAKVLMRSRLWHGDDDSAGLSAVGQFLQEQEQAPEFDGSTYDNGYPQYAKERLW